MYMAQSPVVPGTICRIIILLISLLFLFSKPVNSRVNCSMTQDRYATNSRFHRNLEVVLSNLTFAASKTKSHFYNSSLGHNKSAVFGLYICRGDFTPENCSSCIAIAKEDIEIQCPNKREAIILSSEGCMLRYANRNIFSKEEEEPFAINDFNFVPYKAGPPPPPAKHAPPFDVLELLYHLINQTAFGNKSSLGLPPFFVTRKDDVMSGWYDQAFYSLAQCTPDINPKRCHNCLKQAIGLARYRLTLFHIAVFLPSCLLEFSGDKFFLGATTSQTLLHPISPSPQPSGRNPGETIIHSYSNRNSFSSGAIGSVCLLLFYNAKVKFQTSFQGADEIITMESLQYDTKTIKAATANFSADNKIGQGQLGDVYKGKLQNDQEIAVKRLLLKSARDATELKNEALLIAKLQHKNLVRLMGFCMTEEEKFLIYEFLPNSSLYHFLYDAEKKRSLDWESRYKIIEGTAKGLLYLHEHSRSKIVHGDLKPSNILLDKDMTPKVSGFGKEKFVGDWFQDANNSIVENSGYMAPEYVRTRQLNVKSDVYSFGVVVLELVSGQRVTNSLIHNPEQEEELLRHAWKLWNAKETLAFVDSTMSGNFSAEEVTRCIHIGLSCIQEDAEKRPTIASIVSVLNSHSSNLPALTAPGEDYYKTGNSSSVALDQSLNTYSGITVLSAR